VCHEALLLNQRLISPEQLEYHESLIKNFGNFVSRLEDIFDERVRESCIVHSVSLCLHQLRIYMLTAVSQKAMHDWMLFSPFMGSKCKR